MKIRRRGILEASAQAPLLARRRAKKKEQMNVESRATGRDFWMFADPPPAPMPSRVGGN